MPDSACLHPKTQEGPHRIGGLPLSKVWSSAKPIIPGCCWCRAARRCRDHDLDEVGACEVMTEVSAPPRALSDHQKRQVTIAALGPRGARLGDVLRRAAPGESLPRRSGGERGLRMMPRKSSLSSEHYAGKSVGLDQDMYRNSMPFPLGSRLSQQNILDAPGMGARKTDEARRANPDHAPSGARGSLIVAKGTADDRAALLTIERL